MSGQNLVITFNWRIYLLCALLLVANCLWRVLIPAQDYGSPLSIWFWMTVNLLLMVALVGLQRQFQAQMAVRDKRRRYVTPILWLGLIAGGVVLVIRI